MMQTRPVTIFRLVMKNSIEERIHDMQVLLLLYYSSA